MVCAREGMLNRIRWAATFLSVSILIGAASVASAAAQTKNVKIMLDWIIQGTHAPFFVALEKGYYKAEGVRNPLPNTRS